MKIRLKFRAPVQVDTVALASAHSDDHKQMDWNLPRLVSHRDTMNATLHLYSKTCVKRPLKIRKKKDLNDNW